MKETRIPIANLWKPVIYWTPAWALSCVWGYVLYGELFRTSSSLSDSIPLVFLVNGGVLTALAVFFHVTSLQKNFYFIRHRTGINQDLLQDAWVERINYPVKVTFLLAIVSFPGLYLLTSTLLIMPLMMEDGKFDFFYTTITWIILTGYPLMVTLYASLEVSIQSLPFTEHWDLDSRDNRITSLGTRTKTSAIFAGSWVWVFVLWYTLPSPAWITGALIVIVAMTLTALAIRTLTAPIDDLETRLLDATHISGTLSRRPVSADDFSRIAATLENQVGHLVRTFGGMRDRIEPISRQADEIVRFSKVHNSFSSSHATALAQVSASVEELMKSVTQITENSKQVTQFNDKGKKEIEDGKGHLSNTLHSMEHIHREAEFSSQRILDLSIKMTQIEDVIKIINYVTDQTKILAFNAAIETAGAGETGERFGVVAKEIRQLAQNIADSTDEVKRILLDVRKASQVSVLATEKELKQVREGMQFASQAQESFEQIYWTVRQVSDALQQITQAITQQQSALEQLWLSIKDVDVTAKESLGQNQKIVQSAEELKRAADDIKQQSLFLKERTA